VSAAEVAVVVSLAPGGKTPTTQDFSSTRRMVLLMEISMQAHKERKKNHLHAGPVDVMVASSNQSGHVRHRKIQLRKMASGKPTHGSNLHLVSIEGVADELVDANAAQDGQQKHPQAR
jgi:hypothetical protein